MVIAYTSVAPYGTLVVLLGYKTDPCGTPDTRDDHVAILTLARPVEWPSGVLGAVSCPLVPE